MWERIRTAIILLVIVGVAMFATRSPVLLLPLLLIGAAIGAYEWGKMLPSHNNTASQNISLSASETITQTRPFAYAALVLIVVMLSLWQSQSWVIWWTLATLLWGVAVTWVLTFPQHTERWYSKQLSVIGVVMLTASLTAMYYLWSLSAWWLLYVFVLVWCADSGAYFVGRKFGRRKMAPHVSPNKSVEGLMGGLLTGFLVVLGVAFGLLRHWSGTALALFLLLSLLTIVMSVFGDLFESMLKRHAGVKDSGTILPGHGGILDRIDSQLSAMPIFALGFWLLNYYGYLSLAN